jgi:hypothetical protein
MHVAQLFLTFSTPAEHTNSFISGVPFSSLVASAESNKQLGHFKQKFISVPTDVGVKILVCYICFLHNFESCKFFSDPSVLSVRKMV